MKILCMDILCGGNILVSASTSLMLKHKGKIMMLVLAWWMLYWPVQSYRWFYTWSDKAFQAKTLLLVNEILEKSGKIKKLPKHSQCDYTESSGWKIKITCGEIVLNTQMNKYNTSLYMCSGLKIDKNRYIDIWSGYCARWRYDKKGNVEYYDKDDNKLNTDFFPGRYYPTPPTAHQG